MSNIDTNLSAKQLLDCHWAKLGAELPAVYQFLASMAESDGTPFVWPGMRLTTTQTTDDDGRIGSPAWFKRESAPLPVDPRDSRPDPYNKSLCPKCSAYLWTNGPNTESHKIGCPLAVQFGNVDRRSPQGDLSRRKPGKPECGECPDRESCNADQVCIYRCFEGTEKALAAYEAEHAYYSQRHTVDLDRTQPNHIEDEMMTRPTSKVTAFSCGVAFGATVVWLIRAWIAHYG